MALTVGTALRCDRWTNTTAIQVYARTNQIHTVTRCIIASPHASTRKSSDRMINAMNGLKSNPLNGGTTERMGARM